MEGREGAGSGIAPVYPNHPSARTQLAVAACLQITLVSVLALVGATALVAARSPALLGPAGLPPGLHQVRRLGERLARQYPGVRMGGESMGLGAGVANKVRLQQGDACGTVAAVLQHSPLWWCGAQPP